MYNSMPGTTEYPAKAAGYQCRTSRAQHMYNQSARMFAPAMCGTSANTSATASILSTQTGVIAPVSLSALLITVCNLLLVGLISLLTLSGLTGLISCSVGRITKRSYVTIHFEDIAIGMKAGD